MALDPSSGWSYYKEIQISDTANVSADYQMKLTVYAGVGSDNVTEGIIYCDNHCENFPNDIRFGTTNNPSTATQLAQWIESYDASQAVIWIKLPSDGSDTFYMFVGNPNANLYSSPSNTFIRVIDGVVGSWHFDEGTGTIAHDSSGNENDGTLVNGPTWVDGKFGRALSFDGVDDYVDCGNDDSLNITDAITIAAWAKWEGSGDPYQRIVHKGYSYEIYLHPPTQEFQVWLDTTGTSLEDWPVGTAPINEWTFYAFTFDGSIARGYINGIEKNSENLGNAQIITDPDEDLTIGDRKDLQRSFNGIIDEVLVCNRALTADEITDLYNNYGYTTTNYPGKVLVCKYSETPPAWSSFSSWISMSITTTKEYPLDAILEAVPEKEYNLDTILSKIKSTEYIFDAIASRHQAKVYATNTIITGRPTNLRIYNSSFATFCWCSRWDEDNWNVTIEAIADKSSRDILLENITPGAVAELYNILGEPKFVDTTYSSGNTIWLFPYRGLANLRNSTKIAVKRYSETMLRWDLFKIKIEGVKL